MYAKRHRFLHWLLILALALLPMRAALAVNPGCGMHEHGSSSPQSMAVSDGRMAMKGRVGNQAMNHAIPTFTSANHTQHSITDQSTTKHHCCCCDGDKAGCSSDCSMGLHAPAIISTVFSMATGYQSLTVAVAADALQTRELTPPSRPPLSLHV